jgi:hypothetical protein
MRILVMIIIVVIYMAKAGIMSPYYMFICIVLIGNDPVIVVSCFFFYDGPITIKLGLINQIVYAVCITYQKNRRDDYYCIEWCIDNVIK